MKPVTRYHPLLVTLHWLLAVLIVATLTMGSFWLAATPNADPGKIGLLRVHMAGGMLILALMLVRLVVRVSTARPADATTGSPALDRIARIANCGFYVLVVLMVASGFATALLAGLPAIVFGNSGAPLPPEFATYPTFVAHALLASVLAGLAVVHAVAALYHQFVRRDAIFRRMWFGERTPTASR